jgi:hypothetical protein
MERPIKDFAEPIAENFGITEKTVKNVEAIASTGPF